MALAGNSLLSSLKAIVHAYQRSHLGAKFAAASLRPGLT